MTGRPLLGPHFAKLAEAYGVRGLRASGKGQMEEAIDQAAAWKGLILIDFQPG